MLWELISLFFILGFKNYLKKCIYIYIFGDFLMILRVNLYNLIKLIVVIYDYIRFLFVL